MQSGKKSTYNGLAAATTAYLLWGVLPLYWKALLAVPSWEIICHRILWSFCFTLLLIGRRGGVTDLVKAFGDRKQSLTFLCTATLLGTNWLIYIWAVNAGYIVEASLGYFINPLIAVLFGVLFLRERLRPGQWAALSLAFAGVLYLTFFHGHFPWIGLSLAITFALYSLLRKTARLHSLDGLAFETCLLSLPALCVVCALFLEGRSHFPAPDVTDTFLLVLSGPVTALPLLLFVFGAQRITLTTVGLLQYLAPTLQFLIGRFVFDEPFPPRQLIGFSLIWSALAVYSAESILMRLRAR